MLAGQEGAVGGCLGSLPRCAEPSPPPVTTRTLFSRSILLSLHSVARKSVGSKCAKISSVRMHKQMAESSPPQKEQTASGRGGGERGSTREVLTRSLMSHGTSVRKRS